MIRKILTMITIGSIFLMAVTGCGDSSGDRTTSDDATTDIAERPDDSEAGLYQSDGSFIPWGDLGIDVETDYTGGSYKTEAKSPYKVFKDNGYNGELVFPDTLTRIGEWTFLFCTSLTSIDLSNTQVTSIGDGAFEYCRQLSSVDLSNTQITSIGDNAFDWCDSLTSIDLSNTQITSIGDSAFGWCGSLISIDLSNTQITGIGDYGFCECSSLESIDLPDTLTSIGEYAFANCASLTNINYAGTVEEWNAIDKSDSWNEESGMETITCSDGVVSL